MCALALTGLHVPPQDISPLEGGIARVAAVRTVGIVGGPMALEVFSPLVTLEADRTIMELLVLWRGRHLPSDVCARKVRWKS